MDEVPALWELRETEKPNPKHFSTDEEFWSEGREDVPLGRRRGEGRASRGGRKAASPRARRS